MEVNRLTNWKLPASVRQALSFYTFQQPSKKLAAQIVLPQTISQVPPAIPFPLGFGVSVRIPRITPAGVTS